ncbi:Outer membrane receptor proteins, mostly Fe transport [Sphingobacterium wenxiniae]|uniref:Outer membrane receptor proteins, mostly Fe transport n=2 Tax=Sphingobacterium wenxiniae TaxID=683125 RepID=A0A1I6NU62_9SPHI|nr:Outer membrane receptor proteins, mostly Fe transport [Sphingobacterium wenxiniae]
MLLLCAFSAMAQQAAQTYTGRVLSAGEPVANASIYIENNTQQADENGLFTFTTSKSTVHIRITATGMESFSKQISLGSAVSPIVFELQPDDKKIEQVDVFGRTKVNEVNRQAYNVTAIDATKLYNTTLNISGALDRVAGIRVRESGGVGSNFNLSLNGFSGNHIRYFIDGIPMDNFGSSFQINNIPINMAERVEIYKGVVPMWLGSDALGGAINIVTSTKARNYVDASYSYGSFNTHRTVINAGVTTESGFTFLLNAYQNYSDNNYKVTVDAADIYTGAYTKDAVVRRFHDQYHNEAVVAQVGVVNKPYADRLLVGMTIGQNYKEIQTGARMISVFGGWHRRGNTLMPTLKYQKKDLLPGLDVTLNANFNLGKERNIDTLDRRYDWFGNFKPNGSGGERSKQVYEYRNNEGLATLAANYQLGERHSLALSNVASTFNRKGENLLDPLSSMYERGQRSFKNMLGVGYSYDIKDVWSTTVFSKFIHQRNQTGDATASTANRFGYGLASTYFLQPNLQVKASYELTNRMPTAYEIFGDLENQEANFSLKPERSHNINLGANYGWKSGDYHRFSIAGNLIYRYAYDFIFNRFNNNQSKLVADNREGVATRGADAEIHYSYKDYLRLGGSITYQYLQNKQKYEPEYTGVSPVYNDQMPNIPYFFGNADASVIFNNVGGQGNRLSVGYNLLYVHDFYLYWPSRGGEKLEIMKQVSHDVNAVYSLANGKYNIGLEARNLNDARLYDNFSLQKPGRAFYLNLRYYFQRTTK